MTRPSKEQVEEAYKARLSGNVAPWVERTLADDYLRLREELAEAKEMYAGMSKQAERNAKQADESEAALASMTERCHELETNCESMCGAPAKIRAERAENQAKELEACLERSNADADRLYDNCQKAESSLVEARAEIERLQGRKETK